MPHTACIIYHVRLNMLSSELKEVCSNVWILKWVNLHCNWINLISLSFPKQWVADYRGIFKTLSNILHGVFYLLTIITKHSILDVWQGSEYASGLFKLFCHHSKRDTQESQIYANVMIVWTPNLEFSPYSEVINVGTTFKLRKG